ncbi:MAG TPA: hypothetical protein VIG72_00160 [Pontibacter sp.]
MHTTKSPPRYLSADANLKRTNQKLNPIKKPLPFRWGKAAALQVIVGRTIV